MKREIICLDCNNRRQEFPEEIANGFLFRRVPLFLLKKPKEHGIKVNGEFIPMADIHCDHCDKPLKEGSTAVAVTTWNKNRELEPAAWEIEFSEQ